MGDDADYADLAAACSLSKKIFLHHHVQVTNEGRNHLHKQVHDKEAYLQNHCMHGARLTACEVGVFSREVP